MSDQTQDPNGPERPNGAEHLIENIAPDDTPSYEVGYAKPPTSSQFQPGRSGNPRGRPKGAKSLRSHISQQLSDTVMVKDPQGPKKMLVREAMAKRLVEKGLNGDLKTLLVLLNMDAEQSDTELGLASETLSASEKQILAEVLDRPASS